MLRGKVDTEEVKVAAEEIAKLLDGVKSVKNELQVVAPSLRKGVEDKDEVITARVEKAFAKDVALHKAGIGVMTSAKASWTAWKLSGVKSVKNDLTLKDKGH